MMNAILNKLLPGLLMSYLIGSLPSAYIFGKLTRKIDLREHGSGNLGATNAFRVLGKGIGTIVLMLDILKGTAAVLLAHLFFYTPEEMISKNLYICLAAIAVVCGHNWTIFLKFKGGKGIATSLGSLLAFSILVPEFAWIVLIIVTIWIVLFLSSGFVSLASVTGSVILPVLAVCFHLPKEIIGFLTVLAAFSLVRHKPNILRMLRKEEKRFNTKILLKKIFK
jgi:glycerol-3-phosphate acyltransferase PlsY